MRELLHRFVIGLVLGCTIISCTKDDTFSPDIHDTSLLPDRTDYSNEDYGTQEFAKELSGEYASEIGLIYYDSETREIPQLYLTRGSKVIQIDSIANGAVYVYFDKFNTSFMPLELSFRIKSLLEVTTDTIYLRGTEGNVRTFNPSGPIGSPTPESDDAELIGTYARQSRKLQLFIDPMLPVPVKLTTEGNKN